MEPEFSAIISDAIHAYADSPRKLAEDVNRKDVRDLATYPHQLARNDWRDLLTIYVDNVVKPEQQQPPPIVHHRYVTSSSGALTPFGKRSSIRASLLGSDPGAPQRETVEQFEVPNREQLPERHIDIPITVIVEAHPTIRSVSTDMRESMELLRIVIEENTHVFPQHNLRVYTRPHVHVWTYRPDGADVRPIRNSPYECVGDYATALASSYSHEPTAPPSLVLLDSIDNLVTLPHTPNTPVVVIGSSRFFITLHTTYPSIAKLFPFALLIQTGYRRNIGIANGRILTE